jgi:hypothetical protein
MVLGSVFVGYVVTSLILFRFPTILHKKKRLRFRPAHISHRGGRDYFTGSLIYQVLYAFDGITKSVIIIFSVTSSHRHTCTCPSK